MYCLPASAFAQSVLFVVGKTSLSIDDAAVLDDLELQGMIVEVVEDRQRIWC